ncbi:MAG: hypothetical protein LBG60_04885 [Bifidobacteriaceae bacterium]|jgi:hypothetical protein|nr:hypothetical protein [Bifidobacteriaceae bacterium]
MAHQFKSDQLTPKATMVVEGVLAFSRLVTRYEGEDLAKRVASNRQAGQRYPTTEPYYTISVLDPKVVQLGAVPSLEEQYIAERFFAHKTGKNAGRTGFSFDAVANFPPSRYQFLGHSQFAPIEDDRELDSGLRVRLVFTVFYSEKNQSNGVGLDAVLVMDQAKFFEPQTIGSAVETLRGLGLTVVEPAPAEPAPEPAPSALGDPWGDGATPAAPTAPATAASSGWD